MLGVYLAAIHGTLFNKHHSPLVTPPLFSIPITQPGVNFRKRVRISLISLITGSDQFSSEWKAVRSKLPLYRIDFSHGM
jgi:hypothetical protein